MLPPAKSASLNRSIDPHSHPYSTVERRDRLFGWGTRIRTSVDGVRVPYKQQITTTSSTQQLLNQCIIGVRVVVRCCGQPSFFVSECPVSVPRASLVNCNSALKTLFRYKSLRIHISALFREGNGALLRLIRRTANLGHDAGATNPRS